MKKITLILSITLLLIGCRESTIAEKEEELEEAKIEAEEEANKDQVYGQEVIDKSVVVYRDGCEYLFYTTRFFKGGMGMLTHKGDCKNHDK